MFTVNLIPTVDCTLNSFYNFTKFIVLSMLCHNISLWKIWIVGSQVLVSYCTSQLYFVSAIVSDDENDEGMATGKDDGQVLPELSDDENEEALRRAARDQE